MSRRHAAEKRECNPDAKFGDLVIAKFMGRGGDNRPHIILVPRATTGFGGDTDSNGQDIATDRHG